MVDEKWICQNKLYKIIFQYSMPYLEFTSMNAWYKVLNDKTFSIAKTSRTDGYPRGLSSTAYKFFDKNSTKPNH